MSNKNSFINIIILFCLYIQIFSSSSIAIDFGSEFITTSILLPRKPIKLVENPQGTKINQYLYMKDDEKIFGQNAKVKAIKSPEAVFHHLQEFLGKTEDSPEVKNYLKKYFQIYDITTDPKTKNIKFKLNYGKKDYLFNSQELLAIMFKYIKDFSDKFGNTKIDQFLLTIPCFYTYKQHQALLNAAEMSGMKLVHLIHDNAAVAIKYFNENRIQKEEKLYIFYNMGASYTQVSLVSVHATYQGTKKNMTENQYIKIVDEVYDKNLGGRNFDYNLAKLIYKKYKKKTANVDLTEEDLNNIPTETITRILPYAIKYKEILSANKDTVMNVLGIEKNSEYEDTLTREEFLNVCKDEIDRVYSPIEQILKNNNLNIQNIIQIEFVGGGHRIPIIKETIGKYVPQNKLGVHLNGDDVVVFGAGYYLSNLLGKLNIVNGIQKNINLINYGYIFDISLSIKNAEPTKNFPLCEEGFKGIARNCTKILTKKAKLFPKFGNFSMEKSVSFEYDGDVDIDLIQNDNIIMKFHLKNIKESINDIVDRNKHLVGGTRLKLIFTMDKHGIIKMDAHIQYTVKTFYVYIPPKGKHGKMDFKYLSNPSYERQPLTEEEKADLLKKLEDRKIYTESEAKKFKKIINSGKVNNSTKTETKIKYLSFGKEIFFEEVYPKPMEKEAMKESKKIIDKLWNIQKELLKYHEKKNNLENFLYTKREWIKNTNVNEKYARKEELEKFKEDLDKLQHWFEENGSNATPGQIEDKIKEAKKSFKIFEERIEKENKRNKSIKYFRSELNSSIKQGKNWIKDKPYTEEFFKTVFQPQVEELNKWIDEYEEKLNKVKEYEEVPFDKEELNKRLMDLRAQWRKMKSIKRPAETTEDL